MKRALVLLALATLSTSSARAAPRQKVAVLDVRAVQGVSPGTATILTAIIAGDTQSAGYDVLSQADIGALIGLERQKKMLGCGDDFSCLAEIGGALGAEYVLSTQVGQIGSRFHLSLQLLDARRASVIARVSTFSDTTEDALAATTQRAVAQALSAARDRASAAAQPATTVGDRPRRGDGPDGCAGGGGDPAPRADVAVVHDRDGRRPDVVARRPAALRRAPGRDWVGPHAGPADRRRAGAVRGAGARSPGGRPALAGVGPRGRRRLAAPSSHDGDALVRGLDLPPGLAPGGGRRPSPAPRRERGLLAAAAPLDSRSPASSASRASPPSTP